MYRQKVTTDEISQSPLILKGDAAHHLTKVLRVQVGAEVGAFDGDGRTRLYGVAMVEGKTLTLEAKQPVFLHDDNKTEIILFVCISKGERMTWTIEKAVELGATKIVPVISERTIVRLKPAEAVAKRERWQRVADDAARQCGAVRIPKIEMPVSLPRTVEIMQTCTQIFVAALIPESKPLVSVLENLPKMEQRNVWGWWTGPEGDFTKDEMDLILGGNAIPVSLGALILRAETAAIYGLSVLGGFAFAGETKEKNKGVELV